MPAATPASKEVTECLCKLLINHRRQEFVTQNEVQKHALQAPKGLSRATVRGTLLALRTCWN